MPYGKCRECRFCKYSYFENDKRNGKSPIELIPEKFKANGVVQGYQMTFHGFTYFPFVCDKKPGLHISINGVLNGREGCDQFEQDEKAKGYKWSDQVVIITDPLC